MNRGTFLSNPNNFVAISHLYNVLVHFPTLRNPFSCVSGARSFGFPRKSRHGAKFHVPTAVRGLQVELFKQQDDVGTNREPASVARATRSRGHHVESGGRVDDAGGSDSEKSSLHHRHGANFLETQVCALVPKKIVLFNFSSTVDSFRSTSNSSTTTSRRYATRSSWTWKKCNQNFCPLVSRRWPTPTTVLNEKKFTV